MAKSLISRITDNLPLVGAATSATRAVRSIGKGGQQQINQPAATQSDERDEELGISPVADPKAKAQSTGSILAPLKSVRTAFKGLSLIFSLSILLPCLLICGAITGVVLTLISWGALGTGTNNNAVSTIAQLKERNCDFAKGCDFETGVRLLCEDHAITAIDPETGEEVTVYSSEKCEELIKDEANVTDSST